MTWHSPTARRLGGDCTRPGQTQQRPLSPRRPSPQRVLAEAPPHLLRLVAAPPPTPGGPAGGANPRRSPTRYTRLQLALASFPGVPVAMLKQPPFDAALLARLPGVLAIPLHEFAAADRAELRLHRLCDAVEI